MLRSLFGRKRSRRLERTVWLPEVLLAEMVEDTVREEPNETGGMLLGYVREKSRQLNFVVTDLVAGGPKAERTPSRFVPDGQWQQRQLERIYRQSGQVTGFLGDWHSHPGGSLDPSPIDYTTSAEVAATPEARAPVPLCLIVGMVRGAHVARAHTYEKRRFHIAELALL